MFFNLTWAKPTVFSGQQSSISSPLLAPSTYPQVDQTGSTSRKEFKLLPWAETEMPPLLFCLV